MKSNSQMTSSPHERRIGKQLFLLAIWLLCAYAFPSGNIAAQSIRQERYTVIVVEQQAARVGFYDSRDGSKLGSVAVDLKPHEIVVSKDGKTAYVSNFGLEDYDTSMGVPGNSVSVIDIEKMIEKRRLLIRDAHTKNQNAPSVSPIKAPHGLKLRPPRENELFVNAEVGDLMLVYDVRTGQVVRSFPLPVGTHNFIFSADGETLWLMAGIGGVLRVNPKTGAVLKSMKLTTPVRGLSFTVDGRFLIASGKNEIALLDPVQLTIHKHFKDLGVGQIIYSEPTPDGKYILAPAPFDSQVVVVDIASGKPIHRLVTGKAPIAIEVSPAKGVAYVSNALDNHVGVVDLKTFAVRNFATAMNPNRIETSRFISRPKK